MKHPLRDAKLSENDNCESAPTSKHRRTTTRADLLSRLCASCPKLPRGEVRNVFEMAVEEVAEALARGESVKLRSFGLFSVRGKGERIGRNPRTGAKVPITPRRVLIFKPSPVVLDQVNGHRRPGLRTRSPNKGKG